MYFVCPFNFILNRTFMNSTFIFFLTILKVIFNSVFHLLVSYQNTLKLAFHLVLSNVFIQGQNNFFVCSFRSATKRLNFTLQESLAWIKDGNRVCQSQLN